VKRRGLCSNWLERKCLPFLNATGTVRSTVSLSIFPKPTKDFILPGSTGDAVLHIVSAVDPRNRHLLRRDATGCRDAADLDWTWHWCCAVYRLLGAPVRAVWCSAFVDAKLRRCCCW
jgi:hypothetical protein